MLAGNDQQSEKKLSEAVIEHFWFTYLFLPTLQNFGYIWINWKLASVLCVWF